VYDRASRTSTPPWVTTPRSSCPCACSTAPHRSQRGRSSTLAACTSAVADASVRSPKTRARSWFICRSSSASISLNVAFGCASRHAGTAVCDNRTAVYEAIPGAVAAWSRIHERFGKLRLADVMAPAIGVAEQGFPVSEITAAEWEGSTTLLQATEESARVYLPGGWAPRVGQMFRNPDLARRCL